MTTHAGTRLILLTAVVLLAACGGDGDGQDTASDVSVPNVVGMTEDAARSSIVAAGLTVGSTSIQIDQVLPKGSVFAQTPAGGSLVATGSAVDLVIIDDGNQPPAIPQITGPTSAVVGGGVVLNGCCESVMVWTLAAPTGSLATLTGSPNSTEVRFSPDVPGTYRIELVIDDGEFQSPPAVHTVTVTPAPPVPPVQARFAVPVAGGPVPDSVSVVVVVAATFEIRTVTATLAGREITLAFEPEAYQCTRSERCPGFVGTLSLAGQPTGSYTLTARATDVRGNSDQVSINVTHDNPPALTVNAPLDLSVALPTIPIDARCTDDLPGCVVEAHINWDGSGSPVQSAPLQLNGPLDLSSRIEEGRIELTLVARDSARQETTVVRTIYVQSPARLTTVAELPGAILDAAGQRLLFVERGTPGDTIAIYDRSTGLTEVIALPANQTIENDPAYLTPNGAIFGAYPSDGDESDSHLFLWRDESLTDLSPSASGVSSVIDVSGDYAIWVGLTGLQRLNIATGISALVPNVNNAISVAEDGTVVFSAGDPSQIVRDRAGQRTAVTSDTTQSHANALIAGQNVVYATSDLFTVPNPDPPRRHGIELTASGAAAPVVLAPRRVEDPFHWPLVELDYQVAGVWVAYTDLGAQGQLHVYTRSPQGVITRHTDLSMSSRIERLGDNGEVMVVVGSRNRYFSSGTRLLEVGTFYGQSYRLDGAWYVAIGRALLAVDTSN